MNAARWKSVALIVVACLLSALGGFAVGLQQGAHFAWGESFLWRTGSSMQQIDLLRAGRTNDALVYLEYGVDLGLTTGDLLFRDPFWPTSLKLRGRYDDYGDYAQRLRQLADYRKQNPGPEPRLAVIAPIVQRYASK